MQVNIHAADETIGKIQRNKGQKHLDIAARNIDQLTISEFQNVDRILFIGEFPPYTVGDMAESYPFIAHHLISIEGKEYPVTWMDDVQANGSKGRPNIQPRQHAIDEWVYVRGLNRYVWTHDASVIYSPNELDMAMCNYAHAKSVDRLIRRHVRQVDGLDFTPLKRPGIQEWDGQIIFNCCPPMDDDNDDRRIAFMRRTSEAKIYIHCVDEAYAKRLHNQWIRGAESAYGRQLVSTPNMLDIVGRNNIWAAFKRITLPVPAVYYRTNWFDILASELQGEHINTRLPYTRSFKINNFCSPIVIHWDERYLKKAQNHNWTIIDMRDEAAENDGN